MAELFLNLFIVVLMLVGLFGILVILMQRTSAQAGMGAALGGGAAEQAFGAETTNVLTKATQTTTIIFFVLAFLLYLGFQARYSGGEQESSVLPDVESIVTEEATDVPAAVATEPGDSSAVESVDEAATEKAGSSRPEPTP